MENKVNNDYIEKALNELLSTLGTKEFVNHEEIIHLIESKEIKKAIKNIALYLGLPVEINISYVPKGYQPNTNDGFHSTHIVKTNRQGQDSAYIVAQISIPPNLPIYGFPGMVNFPINVRLSEDCAEYPATLICVMAHELSHIVLHSMWHKEKENEFYTDLTAMLLGFAKIMKMGRKVVKETTFYSNGIKYTVQTDPKTYGYLSDDNFNFAYEKIKNALDKRQSAKKRLLGKLKKFKEQLVNAKKLSFYFKKYLEYLDKNIHLKISPQDAYKITDFHRHDYTDNFQSIMRKNETDLNTFLKFIENLKTYNAVSIETMQKYQMLLKSANIEIAEQDFLLKNDVNVLEKYVSFFYKLKLSKPYA